ncbi:22883_t:CDS:2, partial [Dentiscutata erythropus]
FEDEKRITAINIIKNVFHTYLQLNHSTAPTPTTFLTSPEMPQNLHEYFAHLNNRNHNHLLSSQNNELDCYLILAEDLGIEPLTWWDARRHILELKLE